MIQVDDLTLAYHGIPLFEGLSFSVQPGEKCALVGRNGAGKSSLFRILVGQEQPDRGSVHLPKGYRLGYLDQHIHFSCATLLEEALQGRAEAEEYQAKRLLLGLGFASEQFSCAPLQLSGGYQLRLHLAKMLLADPHCLLLDEPTNYLDIVSIRFLEQWLHNFAGECIIISHDREFLDQISTHTLGLHRKRIKKCTGGTQALFEQIVQEEMVYEKTRCNQEKKRAHLTGFIERFGAKSSKASQAQSKQKMLQRIPALDQLKAMDELNFWFKELPFSGKKMLCLKELSFGYEEDKPLIKKFSLDITKGQRIAIIGKNACGKSTLMGLMAGSLLPQSGGVERASHLAVGYFGQTHIQRLESCATIEEEITSANPSLPLTEIRAICGQMLFGGDLAHKSIQTLSGGEKSRVLLGKILASPCNLLLLDEPTHHLDIESVEALVDAVDAFEGSVVLVTHSELILRQFCPDYLIVCSPGHQYLFQGNYDEFLEKKGWEEPQESPVQVPSPILTQKLRKGKEGQLMRLQKKLEQLEAQHQDLQKALAISSEQGEFDKVKDLLFRIDTVEKQIEEVYHTLMTEQY